MCWRVGGLQGFPGCARSPRHRFVSTGCGLAVVCLCPLQMFTDSLGCQYQAQECGAELHVHCWWWVLPLSRQFRSGQLAASMLSGAVQRDQQFADVLHVGELFLSAREAPAPPGAAAKCRTVAAHPHEHAWVLVMCCSDVASAETLCMAECAGQPQPGRDSCLQHHSRGEGAKCVEAWSKA